MSNWQSLVRHGDSADAKSRRDQEGGRSMFRTMLAAAAVVIAGSALAATAPVGNRVQVNGMQMYYEVSGEGEPLIVLHGAYMNIPTMGAIIGKLADTHKVYA